MLRIRLSTALATIFVLLITMACGDAPEAPAPDAIGWMMANTAAYLDDSDWRRDELEASLWMPELPYARKRLAGYGLGDRGWDLLPLIPVMADVESPSTRADWLALGERVFWEMPMRRDAYLEWVEARPELWRQVGLEAADDGSIRGVAKFKSIRGEEQAAATCGLCHGANGIAGAASRSLDLGLGRALHAESYGVDGDTYRSWGAGRVDVTDDGTNDALAIPSLWGVGHQSYLNRSGAVELTSPAALAVRFETQFIVGHGMEARPNRVLTWALAMYVFSLTREPSIADGPGKAVFDRECGACHIAEQGFAGGLVPSDALTSDPTASRSAFRGTGFYKVPSLAGLSEEGPYLHDGSVADLDALIGGGHPGGELSEGDARALKAYLLEL